MPTNTNINPSANPNAIKARFAVRFIRAMKKLHNESPMREKHKRCRAVRDAACASMASAVGPERAWSRAVLRKIKRQRLLRRLHTTSRSRKLRRFVRRNPRENLGFGQEDDLRSLVPGGRGMGFCSLLSETAHYINCLQAQVQVMTDILHLYPS